MCHTEWGSMRRSRSAAVSFAFFIRRSFRTSSPTAWYTFQRSPVAAPWAQASSTSMAIINAKLPTAASYRQPKQGVGTKPAHQNEIQD